jgi:hypothetical protein
MKQRITTVLLSATVVVAGIVCIYLMVMDFHGLRTYGLLKPMETRLRPFPAALVLPQDHPWVATDVDKIRDWMTFDYINKVFRLPPAFLKDALGITDALYPNITLRRYAHDRATTSDAVILKVRVRINDHLRTLP